MRAVGAVPHLRPEGRRVVGAASVLVLLALLRILYPAPTGIYLVGLVFGALYGLIAVGLILVWRANRIVSFAQGDLGAVPALLAILLVIAEGWNFWAAAAVGLLSAVLLGALVERVVIRRFWDAPRLVLTVATIGLAQVFAAGQLGLPRLWDVEVIPSVPTPFDVSAWIGGVSFSGNHLLTVVASVAAMGGLAFFLMRTSLGTGIRAMSERADRAWLLGIPVQHLSTIVWVIAAVLSAVGAWLRASLVGAPVGSVLGPALLLRALAPAAIARMEHLPRAFVAALAVGVVEQAVFFETGTTTHVDLVLFLAVLGGLLLWRRRREGRAEGGEASSWEATESVRPVPRELRGLPEVRWGRWGVAGAVGLVAVVYPLLAPPSRVNLMAVILIFGIIALSLLVLTGWAGQISLGQMAFVGFGAAVTGALVVEVGVHWLGALVVGGVAGAVVAVIIGVPALRIRGLLLAVTTLAFALAASSYLLNPNVVDWLVPTGRIPRPGTGGPVDLASQRAFYFFALLVFVLVVLAVRRLRQSRMTRALIAARDNEDAARAYGMNVTRLRLSAFALSGFLAAFAGGLFLFHQHAFSTSSFRPEASLLAFSMVVIGGLGSQVGVVLGAVYFWSVNFFLSGPWRLLGTGAGLLLLLMVVPGGLAQVVYAVRDRYLRWVAGKHGVAVPSLVADARTAPAAEPGLLETAPAPGDGEVRGPDPPRLDARGPDPSRTDGDALLRIRDVNVSYGSAQVLFGVDLDVGDGEIVALLGTNGAGKTTLLKAVAGLLRPDAGSITVDGDELTGTPPHALAARGVLLVPGGRGVFPSLTVRENLELAGWLYRRDPEHLRAATERVLAMFGILRERWETPAGQLSGGEQQMLTLGQAFIAKPRLLMIDELSLGLAPVVVEQLLRSVEAIREEGATIVLVEQSVNIALTLAETAYFMEKGEIRFRGPTADLLERSDVLRSVFLAGAAPAEGSRRTGARPDGDGRAPDGDALEVRGLVKRYGGVAACDGVDLTVAPGQILGIIGPNGAGKTTLFDLVSGFARPDAGGVTLGGVDVTGWRPEERAAAGLGRSFQHALLFPSLTVEECIAVALERHLRAKDPVLAAVGHPSAVAGERGVRERVAGLVELLGLEAFRDKFVSELSTGTRRVVDIACTLAHEPSVLLLDEPSSGIAQREVEALAPLLDRVRESTGAAIALIEHDIPLVTRVSDELVAMDLGRVIASGTPSDVVRDEAVVTAYLGGSEAAVLRSGSRRKQKATRPRAKA